MKNYPKPGPPNLGGKVLSRFGTRLLDLPRYYAFEREVAGKLSSAPVRMRGPDERRVVFGERNRKAVKFPRRGTRTGAPEHPSIPREVLERLM
jgi:hypothetical protein